VCRVGGVAGGDDRGVAGADGGEVAGGERGGAGGFGGEDLLPGVGEEHDHLGGPLLAFGLGGTIELAQVVGVAQGVGDVDVFAVWGPAVVNDDTGEPVQDTHRVDRDGASSGVEVVEGQQCGRRGVDPVQ
jgi:hypothetical protein